MSMKLAVIASPIFGLIAWYITGSFFLGFVAAVAVLGIGGFRRQTRDGYSYHYRQFTLLAAVAIFYLIVRSFVDIPFAVGIWFWVVWTVAACYTVIAAATIAAKVSAFSGAVGTGVLAFGAMGFLVVAATGSLVLTDGVTGEAYSVTVNSSSDPGVILASGNDKTECPVPYYYAYDAPVGSNNMGPQQVFADAPAAAYRIAEKTKTGDYLWVAHFVNAINKASQGGNYVLAQSWLKDCTKFKADVKVAVDKIERIDLANAGNVENRSLGMIPGSGQGEMPTMTQFDTFVAMGQIVVVVLKDDTVRLFKADCDIQYSEKQLIKDVPVSKPDKFVPAPQGEGPPPVKTSTVPPSTTPPSGSTTTQPPSSTTTAPPSTTTTTAPPTTTTTAPPTTTTPPPVTTTAKNPDDNLPAPSNQTTLNPAPSGPAETSPPPVPSTPLNPTVGETEPADPEVNDPGATQPETTVAPAPPATGAPEPTDAGNPQTDVDGPPATQAPAPQPATTEAAPAPVSQEPAASPAASAESTPPTGEAGFAFGVLVFALAARLTGFGPRIKSIMKRSIGQ